MLGFLFVMGSFPVLVCLLVGLVLLFLYCILGLCLVCLCLRLLLVFLGFLLELCRRRRRM